MRKLAETSYFNKDERNAGVITLCCMLVIVMIMWLTGTLKPNRKKVAAAPDVNVCMRSFK